MLKIFGNEIKRQVQEFVDYKKEKNGMFVASHHKEWLVKFLHITEKKSVYELNIDDLYLYKDAMMNSFASDYMIELSLHSLRCFLRYYRRHDLLAVMHKRIYKKLQYATMKL